MSATGSGRSTVVCVLGMSRSGTSLTAKILNQCGVYLGPEEELLWLSRSNPDGHWENKAIMRLNEWILRCWGGSWKKPPDLPPGWERSAALDEERRKGSRLLERLFAGRDLWGWKDPRNSFTLPFWRALEPQMHYVVCLRNPIDVAASLARREGFSAEAAFDLWLAYTAAALAHTEGEPRAIVAYEDYFEDWRAPVGRLWRLLGRTDLDDETSRRIEAAIRTELRHHSTPSEAVLADGRVPERVAELYLEARRLAAPIGHPG